VRVEKKVKTTAPIEHNNYDWSRRDSRRTLWEKEERVFIVAACPIERSLSTW